MTQKMNPKEIIVFQDDDGKEPFYDWIASLRDPPTRRRILQRILRLQSGNYGDCQSLKGVFK